MKKRSLYLKDEFKVIKQNCYLYDLGLEKLLESANDEGLKRIIGNVLNEKNRMKLSNWVNELINYFPSLKEDLEIKEKAIFCILLYGDSKSNIKSLLLTLDYKIGLYDACAYCDDSISDTIDKLPFKSSLRKK